MKWDDCAVVLFVAALAASTPAGGEWTVGPNTPDPFCNDPESSGFSCTWLAVWGEPAAEVALEVWAPDTTECVLPWAFGEMVAGYHIFMWYGTDGFDAPLPAGAYPYRISYIEYREMKTEFSGWQVAHISCDTAVEPSTWGRIKSLYH